MWLPLGHSIYFLKCYLGSHSSSSSSFCLVLWHGLILGHWQRRNLHAGCLKLYFNAPDTVRWSFYRITWKTLSKKEKQEQIATSLYAFLQRTWHPIWFSLICVLFCFFLRIVLLARFVILIVILRRKAIITLLSVFLCLCAKFYSFIPQLCNTWRSKKSCPGLFTFPGDSQVTLLKLYCFSSKE